MKASDPKCWEELKTAFGENDIRLFVSLLYGKVYAFYEKLSLRNIAFLDEDIFSRCLIDILYDLKRMKEFHELDSISYERAMAYAAGWIIRRQPLQMMEMGGIAARKKKYQYLNEKFAFVLMLEAVDFTFDNNRVRRGKGKESRRLLDRMLYHLCYRDVSARTIEAIINGIAFGKIIEKN